jgi:hypothetical protein
MHEQSLYNVDDGMVKMILMTVVQLVTEILNISLCSQLLGGPKNFCMDPTKIVILGSLVGNCRKLLSFVPSM